MSASNSDAAVTPAFSLSSPQTGTVYPVYLHDAPAGAPAVLFLDGDDQFAPAVSAYDALRLAGTVPPLRLVGLGYGASYAQPGNRRGRDYTPTAHTDEPTSGGGEAFIAFLRERFWPDLAQRIPIDGAVRGLAGHSLGALLVLQALWQDEPFFTHHLASAPSIWWDDRSILRLGRERQARRPALPARLFLAVGERDSESMLGDLALLEAQLAAAPFAGLAVTSRRFPRRNHFNVLPDAFGAGLAALFGTAP